MEFVRAVGRGIRDFFLFGLVASGVFLAYALVVEVAEGRGPNYGAALTFGPAIAFYGAFLSIPGLAVHRILVRRLDRRGRVRRLQIVALATIITVVDLWWIVWQATADGIATALTSAALVTVTALIYGAIVPWREPS